MLRKMVTFIIISLSLLVGCKVNNENILYLDKPKVQKDNLTINFTSQTINNQSNSLTIYINIKNNEEKEREFKIENYKLFREKDNAEYISDSIVKYGDNIVTLKEFEEDEFKFTSNIPLNSKDERFYFLVTIDNTKYRYNIYEREDKDKETYTVTYMVDGKEVHKVTRLTYQEIGSYFWVSEDYIKCVYLWYYQENLIDNASIIDKVMGDLVLYGRTMNILGYTYSDKGFYYIDYTNYSPDNKEIVVPRLYRGIEVQEFSGKAFNNFPKTRRVDRLYISKNITYIPAGNPLNEVREVHYEGTEEEWRKIYKGTLDGKIVFNSYKD